MDHPRMVSNKQVSNQMESKHGALVQRVLSGQLSTRIGEQVQGKRK